jgi:hypothetical protein
MRLVGWGFGETLITSNGGQTKDHAGEGDGLMGEI